MVAFIGNSLGAGTAAGQTGITFTSAPSIVNGVIPWALSQASYTSDVANATNTVDPDSLAVLGANGVAPLTSFADNDLSSGTNNARLTAANAPAGSVQANTLTLASGGSLALSGALNLSAGAIISTNPTGAITGSGSIVTPGTLYISASSAGTLTVGTTISAAGLSKGGLGSVTLNGAVQLGANPILSVNSGLLTLGPTSTVTASTGTVTYQVSKGATLTYTNPASITGTLRGNGTVNGSVTIASGGLVLGSSLGGDLTSGDAPGTLNFGGPVTLAGGSRLRFNISSALTAGNNSYTQSLLNGTGTLNILGTSGNPISVQVQSLLLNDNGNGPIYDLNPSTSYTWKMATFTGGVVGFTGSNQFSIDLTNYSGNTGGGFTVTADANNLYLNFLAAAVPEPVLLGLVLPCFYAMSRRRKELI
jgi:hypothetical protein